MAKELFAETTALVKRLGSYLHSLTVSKKSTVTVPAATLQTVGTMHHHVAYVQKTCGQLAESLLDDEPHIAKATKVSLNASLQTMQDALAAVKQCQFSSNKLFQEHEAALGAILDRMKKDPCLRHA